VLLKVGFEFRPRLYKPSFLKPSGAHAALIAASASSPMPFVRRLQKEPQRAKE
jgi:hypothetical protein